MDAATSLVADDEATEAAEAGMYPLYLPAVSAEAIAALDAASGNARRDAAAGICCDRMSLLQPRPEVPGAVAVVVDRCGAGNEGFVAAGRDSGLYSEGPNVLAEGMAAVATISHHPYRPVGQ